MVQKGNVQKAKTAQETIPSPQDILLPIAVQRTRSSSSPMLHNWSFEPSSAQLTACQGDVNSEGS